MEIEMDNKSELKMLDIYFEKIAFSNNRKVGKTKLKAVNSVSFSMENNIETVRVTTTVSTENDSVNLELITVGKFEKPQSFSEDITKQILTKNTVSIMFPYIRSQVSLVTAQPGLAPIMLPPIDVNKLIDGTENK
ncbi:MAG: protein-export chaperone SecB [Clostridiales bacterium]|jgi:preprotein translocase subunit SecB|nr:protein-export chaperone SecB [Clostridiales bacterium]